MDEEPFVQPSPDARKGDALRKSWPDAPASTAAEPHCCAGPARFADSAAPPHARYADEIAGSIRACSTAAPDRSASRSRPAARTSGSRTPADSPVGQESAPPTARGLARKKAIGDTRHQVNRRLKPMNLEAQAL